MVPLARLLGSYVLAGVRRRQALTIAAIAGLAQYFVLVYSPPQLRALAIDAAPEIRATALALACAVWMRATRGHAWRLVLAADVRMLRHLPIPPNQWRIVLGVQLAVLDLFVVGVAVYGLVPMFSHDRIAALAWISATALGAFAWRVAQCNIACTGIAARAGHGVGATLLVVAIISLDSSMLGLSIASLGASWAAWRLGLAFGEPRTIRSWLHLRASRSPAVALARLYLACAWSLDRPFVRISIAVQLGAMTLGALACWRVGGLDPHGAITGVRLFACAAGAFATWSALRVERRVAADRWALDPHVGSRGIDLGGRTFAAFALASPLLGTGVLLAAFALEVPFAIEMLAAALGSTVWSATSTIGIAIWGARRDRSEDPHIWSQLVRLVVAGIVVTQLGVAALVALGLVDLWIAVVGWPAAERLRRRRSRIVGEAERHV